MYPGHNQEIQGDGELSEFNLEEAVNLSHQYLFMTSRQLLTYRHRHQSLGAVAQVQFLDRHALLTAPPERYSETIMHYFPYMIR
ncbi:hypothetical protein TNCT_458631 [Trichonephila clavata]|uniref:Uncharacterized protein n=1 Tax=Trichonephila clavata TaxID=2740835 RepID=A0A8X6GJ36_TRICU|nr:hypothetical protein TNCT_458631 [Trichonephila clavata]